MGRGGKNSETRSEVANQSSETLVENDSIKGQFTWEEIRRHSSKNDRWLVIDQRVYDVTKWLKHPGGQMLLNHYAGQDATVRISHSIFLLIISRSVQEAFHAFHPEIHRVQKYLKPFYIGDVSNEEIEPIDEDQAIKEDFAQLREKAVAKVRNA